MRNEKLKLIERAYDALHVLNNHGWSNYRDCLFETCKMEERQHRGSLPEFNRYHTDDTIGVNDAARLYSVKRVAEYLLGDKFPVGKDFLHTQRSCFYAAGLVDEYRQEIETAWAGLDVQVLADLDYTEFVKVKHDAVCV